MYKKMKKLFSLSLCAVTMVFLLSFTLPASGQSSTQQAEGQQTAEPEQGVEEFVEVVNVEVIVRAMKKGKPVRGLKEKDFQLYEEGQPVQLTSFQEMRRKVGLKSERLTVRKESTEATATPKRFFFLYFWVSEPDPQMQEAVEYFFQEIYREGDYVLVMIKDSVFPITREMQVVPVIEKIKDRIQAVMQKTKLEKDRLVKQLDDMFRDFYEEFKDNERKMAPQGALLNRMISQMNATWKEYKNKHYTLSHAKLQAIAESLKTLEMEKWGFVFFQQDSYPQMNFESVHPERYSSKIYLDTLRKEVDKLAEEIANVSRSPRAINDLRQTFINANATFHLLLSGTITSGSHESIFTRMTEVNSDWKLAFKGISQSTGGSVVNAHKINASIKDIALWEDVYYRITYAPTTRPNTTRQLKISTPKKGVRLHYHRNVTLKGVGEIDIQHVSFQHPQLTFTLSNYKQFFDGTKMVGDIGLKITGVDETGEIQTFQKQFQPNQDEMAVSMKLNFQTGGKHSLIVEALDKQSGKKAIFSEKIDVPFPDGYIESKLISDTPDFQGTADRAEDTRGLPNSSEHSPGSGIAASTGNPLETTHPRLLKSLLDRSAGYCEKLKQVTFYFVCTEEIVDSYWLEDKHVKEDRYRYQYQIVMEENGKMEETRELKTISRANPFLDEFLGDKKKKSGKRKLKRKKKDKDVQITNFYSKYPFLLPISMLAKEYQANYRYRLLGTKKFGNRDVYRVSVEPKAKQAPVDSLNYGVVWLDRADGSVVKIEISPYSMEGLKGMMKRAQRKGVDLKVTDIHWYGVKKDGICFPSRTEINGHYLPRGKEIAPVHGAAPALASSERVKTIFSYKQYRFFKVNTAVVESAHQ